MAFTSSEVDEINAAIQRVCTQPCPVCGEADAPYVSPEGFVILRLQDDVQSFRLDGPALPCVAVTCARCGRTELLNAFVLGLSPLVERHGAAEPARAG